MFQQDPRVIARDRDLGLRRISRLTRRASLAGIACSAVIVAAFGHHAAASATVVKQPSASQHSVTQNGTKQHGTNQSSGNQRRGKHRGAHHSSQPAPIVIPAQPPQPSGGAGQVTSGGS